MIIFKDYSIPKSSLFLHAGRFIINAYIYTYLRIAHVSPYFSRTYIFMYLSSAQVSPYLSSARVTLILVVPMCPPI